MLFVGSTPCGRPSSPLPSPDALFLADRIGRSRGTVLMSEGKKTARERARTGQGPKGSRNQRSQDAHTDRKEQSVAEEDAQVRRS